MCHTSGFNVSANALDITRAQDIFQRDSQITLKECLKRIFQYLKNEKITKTYQNEWQELRRSGV